MLVINNMEQNNNQETASFMPLIPRLDRLDRLLELLEEKHSLRRGFGSCESNDGYKTISSALEEVQYKGTLLDRLALLETRVLQLSLDMDEGNTSNSSSSTYQVFSDTTGKDSAELSSIATGADCNSRAKVTPQDVQNAIPIQAKETVDQEGKFVTRITEQHKSRSQKMKSKKGLGLFRFRFIC